MTGEEDALESFSLSPDGRTLALVYDGTDRAAASSSATRPLSRSRSAPKIPIGQLVGAPQWRGHGGRASRSGRSIPSATCTRWTPAPAPWSAGRPAKPAASTRSGCPAPEIVTWKSFDGLEISGVLYRPPARFTGPRPVIINIHGGPPERRRASARATRAAATISSTSSASRFCIRTSAAALASASRSGGWTTGPSARMRSRTSARCSTGSRRSRRSTRTG